MASVLILSVHGDGVPIALRLADEGHIVKLWIKKPDARASLDGYKNPSKVADPKKMLDQYDLILADMARLGPLCDEMAAKGKLVLGGGSFNDKLELDREYGEKVAKSLTKAKLPKTETADTPEQLLQYIEKVDTPQVIKPLGNKPVGLTLVSNDPANRTLRSMVKARGRELVPCIIQEKVNGITIETEGWFNGKEWVRPFNHTIEQKRLFVNDHGPNTGCMGNIVWPTNGDKLTAETLEPLAPLLQKINYVGPIDVNCIVDDKSAYFLEFTPRFGYEAIQTWTELLKEPLFEFLYGVASQQPIEVPFYDETAIGVRLSVTPYPSEEGAEKWKGVQVLDVPKEARKHVWLADVMKQDNIEALAGVDGVVGCVTARGSSVRECQRRAYRTIKNIVIHQDVQYRTDIGEGAEQDREKLKEWGWL